MSEDTKKQAEKVNAAEKAATVPTIPVTILRDIWDENGDRLHAGTVVEMPVDMAMDAVETGAVTRVKKA